MPIIVQRDVINVSKVVKSIEVDSGTNLKNAIAANFDYNFGGLDVDIYLNGKELLSTNSGGTAEELNAKLDIILCPSDSVQIFTRQGVTGLIAAVVAIIAALAVSLLMRPNLNSTDDSNNSSPNNQLNAATNSFRPGEAIPEVFGAPVSYPDFIQPSYYVYSGNLRIQRELFCITVGECQVNDVLSSETSLDDIPSSSYTVYPPQSVIPESQQLIVRETNEITSQALEAPNSDSISFSTTAVDAVSSVGGLTLINCGAEMIDTLGMYAGMYIHLTVTETGVGVIIDGDFIVDNVAASDFSIPLGGVNSSPGSSSTISVTVLADDGSVGNWVGYYNLEGDNNEEAWFHIVCPSGVRTESGSPLTIDIEMEIVQIDANGDDVVGGYTATQTASITDNSLDAQFRTYYFTGLTAGRYKARARRTSDEVDGAAAQTIQIEQIVGVEYQTDTNYGDVTLLWVERKASNRFASGSQSKINVDLVRKLPYYNRSTGVIETGNLVATRDFADAVAYTLCVKGGRDISEVDLAGLYQINDGLPQDLRNFDFTFDDADTSLAERIESICNVARVTSYRTFKLWTFVRDEKKDFWTTIYNRRNTIGDARQVFLQYLPSNNDGVNLKYVNPADNTEKVIYRSVFNGQIVNTEGAYPLEIDLAGCRTDVQAENRIELEIRKILYARNTVEFDALYDGSEGALGDRVRWVDINDSTVFDGEILEAFDDLGEYITSERFTPEAGKTYYVQITDDDGNCSPLIQCYPLSYTEKGFYAPSLPVYGPYTADYDTIQLGSRYVIASDDDLIATDYIITSAEDNDNKTLTIGLGVYNEKIYEAD